MKVAFHETELKHYDKKAFPECRLPNSNCFTITIVHKASVTNSTKKKQKP